MAYTKSNNKVEKKAITTFCNQLYKAKNHEFLQSKDYSDLWKCHDRFCTCCTEIPKLVVKRIDSVVFENRIVSDFLNLN